MTTWLATHRGLRALSSRETARVLKLWTQTIVAPILSSELFILDSHDTRTLVPLAE